MTAIHSVAAHRDSGAWLNDARVRMAVRQRIASRSSNLLAGDPLFPVAVHEAGHCVVARLEGSPINYVMINGRSERGGGRMRLNSADDLTCKLLLAGLAAEVVVLGYCERECARTDLHQARHIAWSTCSDVDAFLDRELSRTIALLESHRDALLALAEEIVDKRYLSGHEVSMVIRLAGVH
jgi:ATP-dependent Zn protease